MPDIETLRKVGTHFSDKVDDMLTNTPDDVFDEIREQETPYGFRHKIKALIMMYLTYLFEHEFIILKRKEPNGQE